MFEVEERIYHLCRAVQNCSLMKHVLSVPSLSKNLFFESVLFFFTVLLHIDRTELTRGVRSTNKIKNKT